MATAARSELRKKGQITIPTKVIRQANLREGDLLQVEVVKSGILLRPVRTVDPDQAWFWTKEWQEKEREATADIKAGKVRRHASAKAFLKFLDR